MGMSTVMAVDGQILPVTLMASKKIISSGMAGRGSNDEARKGGSGKAVASTIFSMNVVTLSPHLHQTFPHYRHTIKQSLSACITHCTTMDGKQIKKKVKKKRLASQLTHSKGYTLNWL